MDGREVILTPYRETDEAVGRFSVSGQERKSSLALEDRFRSAKHPEGSALNIAASQAIRGDSPAKVAS